MAFAQLFDSGIDLCYAAVSAFYYVLTSLVVTVQFLYGFFCHVIIGVTAAMDFVPTCTGNNFACTLKAMHVFIWELGKSFHSFENLSHILVCLVVLLIPFLRTTVATCLTFLVSLMFALFIRIFNVSGFRRRRGTLGYNVGKPQLFKPKPSGSKICLSPSASTKNKSLNKAHDDTLMTCIICYENPKCILLLPCKHACLCELCANDLMKWQKLCPLCRKYINSTVFIYL